MTYKIASLGLPYLFKPIKFYVDYSSNIILKGLEINCSPSWKSGAILDLGCLSFRRLSVISSYHPSLFHFRSISSEQIDRILPNFVYALIFTRSRLGLLPVIFHKFVTEL